MFLPTPFCKIARRHLLLAPININDVTSDVVILYDQAKYIDFSNYTHAVIDILVGALTSTTAMNITLYEATDQYGTGAQQLAYSYIYKTARTHATTSSKDLPVKTAVTNNTYPITDGTDDNSIMSIELRADDLDVADGYRFFTLNITSPGAHDAELAIMVTMLNAKFSGSLSNSFLPSVVGTTTTTSGG